MATDDILKEIRERKEAATAGWQDIRREAEQDMRYVGGDPWDADDKKQRKDRPTVAPEEMGQYFNQVINGLMANPRGMKFSPTGNGANDKGAQFYQNRAREIEYRSNAAMAYITAATNAIQRSYGYVRVTTRYASPRSANQELWIEALPDPDLVLLDPDAMLPDSSDMQFAFVHRWTEQSEHKRRHKLKVQNFHDFAARYPSWIAGNKVCEAEYWTITTKKRQLLLVELPQQAPQQQRSIAPQPVPPQQQPQQYQVFKDELAKLPPGHTVLRELRDVDYPQVQQYFTNGVELLGDVTNWPGKYIPIVSCYGKVLYVPEGGQTKRKILSMTRFGRDPWKAYCYACSQELEIIGQVPKANVIAAAGQLAGFEKDWQEAPHVPKAFLYYKTRTEASGAQDLPPPQRLAYVQGENLQALEMVKEGFRRAIQSAMGSNFLPTQAQRRNEKSGRALDKMEQAAAQGTYHFVYSYKGMIRQVGVIYEDLEDKVDDYRGEVGVILADGKAQTIRINDPDDPDAISTKGDYLVTVSDGPSDDSEREAVEEFTETIVGNLQTVAAIAGPKAAAKVLAQSIRMRTELGAMGAQLADVIDPPQPGQDGKPIPPEMQSLMQQVEQLQQQLQQAGQVIESKVAEKKAEQEGKAQIAKMQLEATEKLQIRLKEMDNAKAISVAHIAASAKGAAIDAHAAEEAQALDHEAREQAHDRVHDLNLALVDHATAGAQAAQDHQQALEQGDVEHDQALELGDLGHQQALAQQQQAADLAPQPEAGA